MGYSQNAALCSHVMTFFQTAITNQSNTMELHRQQNIGRGRCLMSSTSSAMWKNKTKHWIICELANEYHSHTANWYSYLPTSGIFGRKKLIGIENCSFDRESLLNPKLDKYDTIATWFIVFCNLFFRYSVLLWPHLQLLKSSKICNLAFL